MEKKEAEKKKKDLCEAKVQKAEITLEFLNMFGFEMHSDDCIKNDEQLHLLRKSVMFKRATDLMYQLKHLFLSPHSKRHCTLPVDSTRHQYQLLGFTNSIIHEG